MQKKTKQNIPPKLIDERATLNKKSPNMFFKNVISFSSKTCTETRILWILSVILQKPKLNVHKSRQRLFCHMHCWWQATLVVVLNSHYSSKVVALFFTAVKSFRSESESRLWYPLYVLANRLTITIPNLFLSTKLLKNIQDATMKQIRNSTPFFPQVSNFAQTSKTIQQTKFL